MKVCLIAPYAYKLFHPDDVKVLPFGGAEVQQYQLGMELAKDKEYTVSFVVGDFHKGQPDSEKVASDGNTVTLHKTIPMNNRNLIRDGVMDFWRLYRVMKKISADVYMIRGGGSLGGKIALFAGLLGKKFIYSSAHDRDSNGDFVRNHPWFVTALFRYGIRHADRIICQHEGQRKAFKKYFGRDAVIIRSMYPIAPEMPEQAGREYVLWVSRLQNWKQPNLFVDLAKQFPNERFLLITNADATDFRRTIGSVDNLEITENVPLEAMDEYFQKAKLFVNTSTQEGFPNTFVQAAKNGTPIVSLTVDPDGMLEASHMGVCAKGNFAELVGAVKETLENTEMWAILSGNAYAYAKRNHNRKTIVEDFKKLIRVVVGQ